MSHTEPLVADPQVQELLRLRPKLRRDLLFTPSDDAAGFYLVEDPTRGKFFRVGRAEYGLLSLFDGRRTLAEALRESAATRGASAFTEAEATAILHWLRNAELLATRDPSHSSDDQAAAPDRRLRMSRFNPFAIRIPLVRPNSWFRASEPWLHWLFSPVTVLIWSVLFVVASVRLAGRAPQLLANGREIFFLERGLWLGVCWLGLKLIHECAHALACCRYGGSVRRGGVILVLGLPLAYVDVTSSWRFRSRWQRIVVAAAGMYVELGIAAIAALVWSFTQRGVLNDLCFNLIFSASVGTVLFNANPLMRFDGYFILSDWLGLPNLAALGRTAAMDVTRRCLFGVRPSRNNLTARQRAIVTVYGVAASLWSVTVTASLFAGAVLLFDGAKVGVVGLLLIGWSLMSFPGRVARLSRSTSETLSWQHAFRAAALVGAVAAALVWLPAPWSGRTPAVVEYAPLEVLRARSPGWISEVLVRSGDTVREGQRLLVLRNEQLEQERRDLELALEQSDSRLRSLRNRDKQADVQAELAQRKSLKERLREKQQEFAFQEIVAPCGGTVLTANVEQLRGTYATLGQELLVIGDETSKELVLSIDQEDVQQFQESLRQSVRSRSDGRGEFHGELYRVSPSASVAPTHAAFCATSGGPVPVHANTDEEREQPVFLQPRFEAAVRLSAEQSRQLRAGERSMVWPATPAPSLYRNFERCLRTWWSRHVQP